VVDVFQEVDEQLRSDRFRSLVQRAWPYFLGLLVLALLVVIGIWGYGQYRTGSSAKASEAYAAGLDSLQRNDSAKAFDQFATVAKGRGGYAALALMQQAGIRLDQNKSAEAVALFDKAAVVAPDYAIGDLARLKAAYALLDTAPLQQLSDRLVPLTKSDRPYHGQAREALAMAKIGAGQLKEAKADFAVIALLSDIPDSLRQRANAAAALIESGTASSLKALAKASLTAPALPQVSPAGPPQASGPSAPAPSENPQ
jgi:hypothetical protein